MRYVVIGAGAIGGTIAARLDQYGTRSPLLVARGANAEAIRRIGLVLRSPGDVTTQHPELVTRAADARLSVDDVLVFATKTHQVQAALLEWADQPVHDADGTVAGTAAQLLPVLTALNGVESERIALRLFSRVFGVCVWLPAVHLAPGEVTVRIAPVSGVFIVGRYGSGAAGVAGADVDRAFLAQLASDWEDATFRVHPVDDIMRWKHKKLVSNLGNAVQALLGSDAADASELYRAVADEGRAVLAAAGIPIASDEEEETWRGEHFRIRPVAGAPERLGGSTWQSLARGADAVETDYLNGEIALLARQTGVPAPLNEALQREMRLAAASRAGAGSLTTDELRRRLGLG